MDFISIGNINIALVITLTLMLCHFASPYLLNYSLFNSLRFSSFAGGAAVSYVFLHMLPGLIEAREPMGKVLGQYTVLSPLYDISIFVVALLAFNLYYGLECLAEHKSEENPKGSSATYYLHLGVYSVSNFLITYTMPLRVQSGIFFAVVFTTTMALHFMLIDRHFNKHFAKAFKRSGRLISITALFLGWFVSAITDPVNVILVSFMAAFLSGSVLYGVFREELPVVQGAKFLSFTLGLLSIGALLVWQAALGM